MISWGGTRGDWGGGQMLSIVKNTIGPKMSADDPNHHFIVKPFPGATVSDMRT